jgi:flagellar biosynthesis anti-sigma factor FlgM
MIDPVSKGPINHVRSNVTVVGTPPTQVLKNVRLSKLLDTAAALAAHGPPIDHARIEQIKRAIATGTYRVDATRIAEALLQ